MNKISLTIDDVSITTKAGMTILEAAREAGIYIPTLCSRPDLPLPLGDCRVCVVAVDGAESRFPSACITPVTDGMTVHTGTPQVQEIRRHFFKALLSPLPEPRLKRLELKKLAEYIGLREEDLPPYVPRGLPVDREQPLFELDHNRCILCGLCVRICQEVRGVGAIGFLFSNGKWMVGPSPSRLLKDNGCRFCGACVEVCPTAALTDKGGEPGGREQEIAPCSDACPAHIDIPRYTRLVAQRRFAEAAAVIHEKVPFPEILGRVCLHPCEEKCRRGQLNEPVAISALKRVAAERDARTWHARAKPAGPTGRRVAIVGSGPAGLTAGYYLTKRGHSVTVFEELHDAGGMMRVGIPEYRLPRDVLDAEIDEIRRAGVELRVNTKVKSLDSLFDQGYDAILLAIGSHKPLKLNVEGEESPGVTDAISFLRDANSGRRSKIPGRVGVIGGGDVAIDAARTSLRLGAKEVQLICLESREEMPAHRWAIQQAVEEGVVLNCSWGVERIVADGNRPKGIECIRCTCAFDEKGRLNPAFDKKTKKSINVDNVIVAIGQNPDLPAWEGKSQVQTARKGTIKVNDSTLKTSRKGVFAAGDAVSGTASLIEAIALGRKAAASIDKYLGGRGDIDESLVDTEKADQRLGAWYGFADLGRAVMPCLPVKLRTALETGAFAEIETGFDEETAVEEAKRCLQCQLRYQIQQTALPPVR